MINVFGLGRSVFISWHSTTIKEERVMVHIAGLNNHLSLFLSSKLLRLISHRNLCKYFFRRLETIYCVDEINK